MRKSISAFSPYEMAETLSKAMQTFQKQNNADRIRAMTDEELADWLYEWAGSSINCDSDCVGTTCRECWLEWLKQEADNG